MNYWERQQWRDWFAEIDKDMDTHFSIWYRLYISAEAKSSGLELRRTHSFYWKTA